MNTQPGIFALGTTDHCYLEFDVTTQGEAVVLIAAAADVVGKLSTTAGVNVVVGVRPSLWQAVADPAELPRGAHDWQEDLVGPDGFTMPATQHDLCGSPAVTGQPSSTADGWPSTGCARWPRSAVRPSAGCTATTVT